MKIHQMLVCFVAFIGAPQALQAQYALGDGRALDANLSTQGRYNPPRDPLAAARRNQNPLYDGLGGRRFDDRFVRDGLRFAPEFQRGNSIYHRSLLFDYQASRGWDVNSRAIDQRIPLERQLPLTQQVSRPQAGAPVRSHIVTQRMDSRINTKRETLASPQRPEIRVEAPLAATLSNEQIIRELKEEAQFRIQSLQREKEVFGDIRERKLGDSILGFKNTGSRAATILGLTPSIRYRMQIEQLNGLGLIAEAKKYSAQSTDLHELIVKIEDLLSKKPAPSQAR